MTNKNITEQPWQKYLLHTMSMGYKNAKVIEELTNNYLNAINDLDNHISYDDFLPLKHDMENKIHIPMWNDINEVTPNDMKSYTEVYLVYPDGLCTYPQIAHWCTKDNRFCIVTNEDPEGEKVWPITYWMPMNPPSLY